MPVTFKGDSEYHEKFKTFSSPKSATFSPTRQPAAPTAGLSSPQVSSTQGFMDEPAILRKKKPIPLVTTSTTKIFDDEIVVPDDYMLLGSQEKFASNVQYKDYLTKNRTRVLGTTYVAPQKPIDFEAPQRSVAKPLARIDFNTGAPTRTEKRDVAVAPDVQVTGTSKPLISSKTRVIAKEPSSPVLLTQAAGPKHPSNSKTFAVPRQSTYPDKDKAAVVVPQGSAPTRSAREPAKSQAVERIEEARRFDDRVRMTQKQDQNIDNTYAMKYRAGLAPNRNSAKRKSEYNYNYSWKRPIESTPLLAAEQIVHNRNPQIGPYKVGVPKNSEYRKEFKAWKYKPVVSQDDSATLALGPRRSLQGSKLRRTKSEMDITPDRLPAAGSPSRVYHDNARLTQSLNPQKPFFPHRRTVSWTTEYKSNFQAFNKFQYDKGAWKGAAPPHIKQQMTYEQEDRPASSSWTAEVAELREKAEEYRKRSNGTHFSRAHVAQLLSDNSKLWDVVSVNSDLSALDLEQSQASTSPPQNRVQQPGKRNGQPRQRTQSAQAALRGTTKQKVNESCQTGELVGPVGARKRLAWSSDGGRSTSPSDSARSIRSSSSPTITLLSQASYQPANQKSANRTSHEYASAVQEQNPSSQSSSSSDVGRVQTPELAASPVVHRHHLDITTPNRRGMILSSPPHKHRTNLNRSYDDTRATGKPENNLRKSARTVERQSSNDRHLNVNIPKTQAQGAALLSPTYGKPTPDTHPLLNEDIAEPVDMILETRYVQSPQPKVKGMSSLLEGAGMTYKVPDRQDDPWKYIRKATRQREVDECSDVSRLSASMMSVISSTSSLASEVLERATQRQKQFWGTPTKA